MDIKVVPVSAVLPTRNRGPLLERFLKTLKQQTVRPAEIVICDASDDAVTKELTQAAMRDWNDARVSWQYQKAVRCGLAPQRNQAVEAATQPFVWFLDDDVLLEPECLENMHGVIASDEHVGGVTATITNQGYSPPGKWTRALMKWFEDGRERKTYASACVGPGWTFFPDVSHDGPSTMPAEWLIGCCSMYRKSALAQPAVPAHFEGAALGEDLAASLGVGRTHRLLHVRGARCFHDSQGGDHKRSQRMLADQGLRNRYYIMTRVMGKNTRRDQFDFALMLAFGVVSLMAQPTQWRHVLPTIAGYAQATWKLLTNDA
jgi:GT2 family glycosyltransferase